MDQNENPSRWTTDPGAIPGEPTARIGRGQALEQNRKSTRSEEPTPSSNQPNQSCCAAHS
jgi:hypothetical protein